MVDLLSTGNVLVKAPSSQNRCSEAVRTWLIEHGVAEASAVQFLHVSGCDSVRSVAAYLRMQLPPLQRATVEAVLLEMWALFGVRRDRAQRIIRDADVFNALNVNIHEAVSTHLYDTASRKVAMYKNTVYSEGTIDVSLHRTGADRCPPPSSAPDKARSNPHTSVTPPHHTQPSPSHNTASIITTPPLSCTPHPANTPGKSAQLTMSHPLPLPAGSPNPAPPSGCFRCLPQHLQQPHRSYASAALHIPDSDLSPQMPLHLTITETTCNPQQPNAAAAIQPHSHTSPPTRQGNATADYATADYATADYATADLSMSIAMHPPASTSVNRRTPGQPTGSHELEPGPFHRTNAALRRQLPHLTFTVHTPLCWGHIAARTAALLCFWLYAALRLVYLATGRSAAIEGQDVSVAYSWVMLVAEGAAVLAELFDRHHLCWRQELVYSSVAEDDVEDMATEALAAGAAQTVHVLIAACGRPADIVRECVLRLLVAPEPVYMEKVLHVCCGRGGGDEARRVAAMVEQLRALGHTNVHFIKGSAQQQHEAEVAQQKGIMAHGGSPGLASGCGSTSDRSAALNRAMFDGIYRSAQRAEDVPESDVLMVVACGHCAKPELFNRVGPCMRDRGVDVVVLPPASHAVVQPDPFDAPNADSMHAGLPHAVAAGLCIGPGADFAVRARAAFRAALPAPTTEAAHAAHGGRRPQLFSEEQDSPSADAELGARLQACGCRAVAITERLITAEVPPTARPPWHERRKWLRAGHVFPHSPHSRFCCLGPRTRTSHRALHHLAPLVHALTLLSAPITASLPFLCAVLRQCPYGLDARLLWTHLAHCTAAAVAAVYHPRSAQVWSAIGAHITARVLWLPAALASFQVLLDRSGLATTTGHRRRSSQEQAAHELEVSSAMPGGQRSPQSGAPRCFWNAKWTEAPPSNGDAGGEAAAVDTRSRDLHMYNTESDHSTAQRGAAAPACPPRVLWDGWGADCCDACGLLVGCIVSLVAAGFGMSRLDGRGAVTTWAGGGSAMLWLSVASAVASATPGLLCFGYQMFSTRAPGWQKAWYCVVAAGAAMIVLLIQLRLVVGFLAEK
eukprot:jgi/Ulvmu1/11154/UM071_0038.1